MTPTPNRDNGNGRDGRGRFAKGNGGGPGNPHARRVAELRRMLADAVTADDLAAVARALIDRAKAGDVAAARELLDRIIGRPTEAPDPDRVELDELQLAAQIAGVWSDAEITGALLNVMRDDGTG